MRWVAGTVMRATGMASGVRGCQDIGGTIKAQKPFFAAAGLDIGWTHNGTINLDISPLRYQPVQADLTVRDVVWHPDWPAEAFSLFEGAFRYQERVYRAYAYYPHPESKPTEFLGNHMVEVLTEYVEGIAYGDQAEFGVAPLKMTFS